MKLVTLKYFGIRIFLGLLLGNWQKTLQIKIYKKNASKNIAFRVKDVNFVFTKF